MHKEESEVSEAQGSHNDARIRVQLAARSTGNSPIG